jgi:hypothetical protein
MIQVPPRFGMEDYGTSRIEGDGRVRPSKPFIAPCLREPRSLHRVMHWLLRIGLVAIGRRRVGRARHIATKVLIGAAAFSARDSLTTLSSVLIQAAVIADWRRVNHRHPIPLGVTSTSWRLTARKRQLLRNRA